MEEEAMEELEEDTLNLVDTLSFFKFHQRRDKLLYKLGRSQPETSDTNPEFILTVEHSLYTDVAAVGLQVWNGALLLSDYIIHEGSSVFREANVLELSSGTGFVGIIASIFCKHILCTDIDEVNILKTIQKNFDHNKPLVKAKYTIRELNFFKPWSTDVVNFVKETAVVLVSEIIYDNEITDSFIATLNKIFDLQPSVKVYMTLEKRFIFTLANLKTEAVHYEYFFRKINELKLTWKLQKLDTNLPRYFFEYDRSKELELWKISLN